MLPQGHIRLHTWDAQSEMTLHHLKLQIPARRHGPSPTSRIYYWVYTNTVTYMYYVPFLQIHTTQYIPVHTSSES